MPRLSAARREAGIEITPLIDVVFLLLIFFMVSANFVQKQVISVTLPEADMSAAGPNEAVKIVVDASGDYWIDGEAVGTERADLVANLTELAGALSAEQLARQPIEIRADALATHQAVVRVLDVCAALGLVSVSLATATSTLPIEARDQ